jgi:hypothetical protein
MKQKDNYEHQPTEKKRIPYSSTSSSFMKAQAGLRIADSVIFGPDQQSRKYRKYPIQVRYKQQVP